MSTTGWITRLFVVLTAAAAAVPAQDAPNAGDWKTWVIESGKDHGVPPPPNVAATRGELDWLRGASSESDPRIVEQIRFWDSGPPSYRWMDLIVKRQIAGEPVGPYFVRAYAYVSLAIYDATVAAWNAKQAYQRARPSEADSAIRARVPVPRSPSYPSDYAATAAAAAAVMAYLVPAEAAHFQNLAEEAGKSRLYAGVEHPSDYFAGMELGRRVAEQVIAKARADGSDAVWTGSVPTGRCMWTGTNPGNVTAMGWRPLLLTSPSEFRPPPPPSCDSPEVQAQLAEVRNFPRALTTANLGTNARALYWQTPEGVFPWAFVHLNRWILEDKLELNPPRPPVLTRCSGRPDMTPSSPARTASSHTGISGPPSWILHWFRCSRRRISPPIHPTIRLSPQPAQRYSPICSPTGRISSGLLARKPATPASGPEFTTKWIISPV